MSRRGTGTAVLVGVCLLAASACNILKSSESSNPAVPTAPSSVPPPTATAPTVSGLTALPREVGIVSVTEYRFQPLSVFNPSGAALTYQWEFGDGGTAIGQTVNHVYTQPGNYTVTLRVSNSAGFATTNVGVTVRSLTGRWRGIYNNGFGRRYIMDIFQTGTTLQGTYRETNDTGRGIIEAGQVAGRRLQLRVFEDYGNVSIISNFVGDIDDDVNRVTGIVNFAVSSFELTRER